MRRLLSYPVFFLCVLLCFSACNAPKYTQQALPASTDLTIAVVPCIVEGADLSSDAFSRQTSEVVALQLSDQLQRATYDVLFDYLQYHYPRHLQVQPISETNITLDRNRITLAESWQMSPAELAEMLDVDAVLRMTIKYEPNVVRTVLPIGAHAGSDNPQLEVCNWEEETWLRANFYEGNSGLPLWSIGKKKPVRINRNPQRTAQRVIGSMVASLPNFLYFHTQENVTQSEF